METGIARAVEAIGGQAVLARAVGVSRVAVVHWLRQGWVPNGRVLRIEQLTGVPRGDLANPSVRALMAVGDGVAQT